MKTKMMGAVALLGLMSGLVSLPANAHGSSVDIGLRLGPAYVYYNDGFRRVDHRYRYGPRNRYRNFTTRGRHYRDRDLWHRCFDGRWFRYYDRNHRRFHENLRYKRGKRYGHRHRHW